MEAKETVIVTLWAASGYTVGTNSKAKVTITSEDVAEGGLVQRQGVEGAVGALGRKIKK